MRLRITWYHASWNRCGMTWLWRSRRASKWPGGRRFILAIQSPSRRSPDLRELRDQLRDLANKVAEFFDEAEKNIAAHPAQSVICELLVGKLIGRVLASR